MTRSRLIATALATVFVLVLAAGAASAGAPSGKAPSFPGPSTPGPAYEPGVILVGYDAGVTEGEQQQIEQSVQATEEEAIGAGTHVLRVASGSVEAKIATLERTNGVRYAQPNYIHHADLTPNDPSFGSLWGLLNTGQTVSGTAGKAGADISATKAWDIGTGSKTIVVGVVDTGVQYTHADLAANVWSNPGGIGGCAAGTHGYNAITKSCDPMDDHDHGTHVSGTIGAVGNNGVGVAGVNWNVSIMGLKFLNSAGSGTTADAISAIEFAVQAKIAGVNVRALNNSWGGGPFEQALLDEINKANSYDILFLAAAGNDGLNNDVSPHYPSSYKAPNVVSVAATDQTDGLAYFSNYGSTSVNLGAPGTNIYSTVRGGYAYFNGTSMATPHVTGAAALILSKCSLTTAALKSNLLTNVDPLPSLSGLTTTGGRLNVSKALSACATPPAPDYSLSATPASQSVVQGSNTTFTVNIARAGGFTGAVSLSTTGLPAGATAAYSPNPATGASSTLTVTTATTTPTGSYPLTITGTSGTLSRTTSVTLTVTAPAAPNFTLSASPASQTVVRGASTTYTVTITRTGGFTGGITFSTSGLGTGATASYSPNPATAGSSMLTVTTTATAATGTFPLTITGTSGSLSRTARVTLVVNAAAPRCVGGDGEC